MAHVKLNISLDDEVARHVRQRAHESNQTISGYLSALVRDDARRAQDELAAEGYRELAEDLRSFARDASAIAHEVWSE